MACVIHSIKTLFPTKTYTQETVRNCYSRLIKQYQPEPSLINDIGKLFANSTVKQRHLLVDPTQLSIAHKKPHCASKRWQNGVELVHYKGLSMAQTCLHQNIAQSCLSPTDFSHAIYTGDLANFSYKADSTLFFNGAFSKNIHMTPLTNQWCGGGVSALSKAYEYARSYPHTAQVTVQLDLFSLFMCGPYQQYVNMIMSQSGSAKLKRNQLMTLSAMVALTGDATGSMTILSRGHPMYQKSVDQGGVVLLDQLSYHIPQSQWCAEGENFSFGLVPMLRPELPKLVSKHMKLALFQLLEKNELNVDDIGFWCLHPGGPKVLSSIASELEIHPSVFQHSANVLQEIGNCGSATVVNVIQSYLASASGSTVAPQYGIIAAVGPGLKLDLILAHRSKTQD